MKRIGVLIALALALVGAPASAQTQPRPSVITNPDWLLKPDGKALEEAYPAIASDLLLDGRAVIDCRVLATGALSDCSVLSEQPRGLGFGASALSMADKFRMRPATRDGAPTDGGTVRIPIRFTPPAPPKPPSTPLPPADPQAIPPARALVAHLDRAILDQYFKSGPPEYAVPPAGAAPDIFRAAVSALRDAMRQERQALLDALEQDLARIMSPAELQAAVQVADYRAAHPTSAAPPALTQSEAAKGFQRKFAGLEMPPLTQAVAERIAVRARDAFCPSHDCLAEAEPSGRSTP